MGQGSNNLKAIKDIEKALPKNLSKLSKDDNRPINALPDYEIRTMRDDLAELGLTKLEREARGISTEEELETGGKPGVPIIKHADGEIKREVPPPEALPTAPKKSALPSTEELVSEKEKEMPFIRPRPEPAPEAMPEIEEALPIPETEKLKIPKVSYAPAGPSPKKRILLLIIVAIITITGFGVGAFFLWPKSTPEPTPTPTPPITTPQPSVALISVNETKTITLTNEKSLFESLKEEIKSEQAISTFKRIAILKNEKEFLSLNEFFQTLEIHFSPYALSDLKTNYTLIVFNQNTGKRLGIVAEAQNPEDLKNQMRIWEQTMLDDFKNFYPSDVPGARASKTFLDDIYQGIAIRYVNLPYPTLTLNYTILGNLLIIGTSKELMYMTIDKILGK
jgi:hypothetical protein